MAQVVKKKKTHWPMQETLELQVQSLGRKDLLEEGMATHSSILAWRIPQTEKPDRLSTIGSKRVRHDGSNLACTNACFVKFFIFPGEPADFVTSQS